MNKMSPEILLAEIDDIIRVMPPAPELRADTPENMSWIARASAAMILWSPLDGSRFEAEIREMIESSDGTLIMHALRRALTRLRQASHQLRMQTTGPLSIAVVEKRPFEYFNEVRTIIEGAKVDLFFVDPYLDAEFADRYLPQVSSGVLIRLLARERVAKLKPAIELLQQQETGLRIEVRSTERFHDRYFFIDKQICYQSGASFKDGAKTTPTTLTQIVDAFPVVLATYEKLWGAATVIL